MPWKGDTIQSHEEREDLIRDYVHILTDGQARPAWLLGLAKAAQLIIRLE